MKHNKIIRSIKKLPITLIEMIVVMILIATITGALAYNYRESLNEGRAFRTRENIARIEDIITIYLAENPQESIREIPQKWETIIKQSPLIKDPENYIKDGWGVPFIVQVIENEDEGSFKIVVSSKEYEKRNTKKSVR